MTEAQENLLAHRPNFTIIPKCPPNGEYIAAIEQACCKLNQGDVEDLRVEVENALKKTHLPKCNITKEEFQAIRELKKDYNRMIYHRKGGGYSGIKQGRLHQEGRRSVKPTNIQEVTRRSHNQTEDQTHKPA